MQDEFPDVEPVIVDYQLEMVPTVHSCLELPPVAEFNDRLPVAQYTRIGGTATRRTWSNGFLMDRPRIDVDVSGGSREEANLAVKALRAALLGIAGTVRDGVAFSDTEEVAGPGRRPDASQNITRIGFTVAVTVRFVGL
ncbi:hypothetical protein [Actinomadura madurae]|uniref:hypothetical protein n=1 Tax=Actinomadura madurae TaxID=1993 RepID=UPI0020D250DE|nr:hypothetical protein [Actinomadura madurae]MCP9947277.1 hypothetical protein [Actinomadura madurae]MCP9964040.1 hypothetical protein [Actinomadura madurae]MCP9976515.1 hypothetical protein [Actinomadura madurae]MCQ0011989.1 hypothetical protein [Actinomadura madurae]MCQ0012710.1 hypothetical protein [Actinomadura madurae]